MSKNNSETVTISKAEYESLKNLKDHCAQLESEFERTAADLEEENLRFKLGAHGTALSADDSVLQ